MRQWYPPWVASPRKGFQTALMLRRFGVNTNAECPLPNSNDWTKEISCGENRQPLDCFLTLSGLGSSVTVLHVFLMSLGISFLGENFCVCQVCRKQGNENETDCWESRVGTSFPSCRQCCVLLRLLTLSWGLNLESDSWVSSPQDCGSMGHPRGLQLPWVVRMAAPVARRPGVCLDLAACFHFPETVNLRWSKCHLINK